MKYQSRQLLDRLAAQYAVGTLRGRARLRFEKICASDSYARRAVMFWEDRLLGMLAQVKPVAPPKHVWSAIEQRLGFADKRRSNAFDWIRYWMGQRWNAVALAGIAALTIGIGMWVQQVNRLHDIAVIAQQEGGELWRVRAKRGDEILVIEATARVTIDATHAYELWALPASGAAPVSLGLLPTRGNAVLVLDQRQLAALNGANKIAVSLEPLGGSPNGAPTQVLHVTDVMALHG